MTLEDIKIREEQKIFQKNYSPEMLLAVIDLKQVEPLCRSMEDNEKFFSFESEDFAFDANEGAKILKDQKEKFARVMFDLKGFSAFQLSTQMQDYIFSMCKMLLKPALKFGYAEEGLELLKMMRNSNLVGENAGSQEYKKIATYAFDMEMAILGLRYQHDGQPRTKVEARSLINQICAGKFGDFSDMLPEHYKEIFLSPSKTIKGTAATKEKAEWLNVERLLKVGALIYLI